MDPITTVGTAALLEVASGLAGVVQGMGTVVDWVKAQEGLKYNNYTFEIPRKANEKDEQEQASPASAATAKQKEGEEPASIAISKATIVKPVGNIRPLLTIKLKGLTMKMKNGGKTNETPLGVFNGLLQFGLALRKPSAEDSYENGQVVLVNSFGFDSGAGSQAELEFSGVSWNDIGHLVTFQGQINQIGLGFERIAGAVLVSKRGVVSPQGSWEGQQPNSYGVFFSEIQNNIPWAANKGFEFVR